MPTPSKAKALAAAIEVAADAEPRMQLLLWPAVETADGRDTISFYWYDVAESTAADTVIEVAEYAEVPPELAAKKIINSLFD